MLCRRGHPGLCSWCEFAGFSNHPLPAPAQGSVEAKINNHFVLDSLMHFLMEKTYLILIALFPFPLVVRKGFNVFWAGVLWEYQKMKMCVVSSIQTSKWIPSRIQSQGILVWSINSFSKFVFLWGNTLSFCFFPL